MASLTAKLVAVVGTLCVLGAVLTLLPVGKTGQTHSFDAVDLEMANRQKAELTDVQGIEELCADVYNHTSSMRWAIFGFNAARTSVQPLAYGSKTWDWIGDFKTFMEAFPEDDVAFGVYDFEYWMNSYKCKQETGKASSCFASRSVMFTWSPEKIDSRRLALGGYYLGAVLVAAEGFGMISPLSDTDHDIGYMGVCDKLLLDGSQCHVADSFANGNCPFEDETGRNPCNQEVCRGTQLIPGGIPGECCTYISEYCASMDDEDTVQGCHVVALHMLEESCHSPLHAETPHLSHDVHFSLCAPKCVERDCIFFKGHESFKYCNACTEEEAKCYPGAVDYKGMTCCPTSQEAADSGICATEEYQNPVGCGLVKERGCGFLDPEECPAFETTAVEEEENAVAEEEAVSLEE